MGSNPLCATLMHFMHHVYFLHCMSDRGAQRPCEEGRRGDI